MLKAGLTCKLKQPEVCENTAIAMETVVTDMIGLTSAVAKALNSALKTKYDEDDSIIPDRDLIQLWCEFYSQDLLPQTKAMMKSSTPTLDEYGLFLPSRIGTTVSQELLQKGLKCEPPSTMTEPKTVNKDEGTGQGEGGGEGLKPEGEDDGEENQLSLGEDDTPRADQDEGIKQAMSGRGTDYGNEYDEYDEYEYDDDSYDDEYYDE